MASTLSFLKPALQGYFLSYKVKLFDRMKKDKAYEQLKIHSCPFFLVFSPAKVVATRMTALSIVLLLCDF